MNIIIRELYLDDSVIKHIFKWANDKEIQHFLAPNFDEHELGEYRKEEIVKDCKRKLQAKYSFDYLVFETNTLIGECNITIDPEHLSKKEKNTGWIALAIGERGYRGKGIGSIILKFIERKCIELNLQRIELGVFEFNKNAIKLYQKMGYKKIAVIDNFTYYNGEWHKDIRFEKYISD